MKAKYLCLAIPVCLVMAVAMSGMATAQVDLSVYFNSDNPDIDISIHKERVDWEDYTPPCEINTWFSLKGSSHAEGEIAGYAVSDARAPVGLSATFTGTGSDGSFKYEFGSHVTGYEYGNYSELWNMHGGEVEGVTGSSLNVNGGATAVDGWQTQYKYSNAGQNFSGEAENGEFYGGRYWHYHATDTEEGAFAGFNMDSDSAVEFVGNTDSMWYGDAWTGGEGLGFGAWIADSSLSLRLETTYPYTSIDMSADHIVGETAFDNMFPGFTDPH